jgi:lysophospholipase L1-like esterase
MTAPYQPPPDERLAVLAWHEPGAAPFRLSGFPWYGRDRVYRRLPVLPAGALPAAVHELADCTAGGQVAFQSDTRRVAVRVELAGPAYMNHMPATGQCGFDLYLGPPGRQRYHNTARYDLRQAAYDAVLFDHPDGLMRTFTLNFPLYQGVKRVLVGLDPGASLRPPPPWTADAPIVIYGTSITQGGCASRPGLAYTNALSRALNREVVNLGFSGSGCGEPEVLRWVAEVPRPGLLVLDYEANAGPLENYRQTLPAAIRQLRAVHPDVPLLVVSRIVFAADYSHAEAHRERLRRRRWQQDLVAELRGAGDPRLYFMDGAALLGPAADECTVDGIHPNDVGFTRMARGFARELRKILADAARGPGARV